MVTFVSWLGHADIQQMHKGELASLANIAIKHNVEFDNIILLVTEHTSEVELFKSWLTDRLNGVNRTKAKIKIVLANIDSPVDYSSIADFMRGFLSDIAQDEVFINLTSGTPAMTAISILIGSGLYNCKLLQSQDNETISAVNLPFDFHAAYKEVATHQLIDNFTLKNHPPEGFENLVANSSVMQQEIKKAQKLALVDLPSLILGETGTGKEVMAQAIHRASERSSNSFVAINCGAIPENLIESVLFGHVKGAFTGAVSDSIGMFEQAKGGTLFLDEFGELSLSAQVKLLRVLQERVFTPIGGNKLIRVDARVIAATHRDLY
jgi:transcriptional regulator with PAS, ATPase and Fis domain